MQIFTAADCIFHVKELLPTRLCSEIIEKFEGDSRRHSGYTVSGLGDRQPDEAVKVSTDLEIRPEEAWAAAHAELHLAVSQVVLTLAAQFPPLQVYPLQWTGYKIQRYRKDEGYFKWHFDALGPGGWERQMAMVIYLNSVGAGGETCFHRQGLKVKPVAGEALFFPTFWTHMHCGEVPRSGDKYVISSFVRFAIPAVDPTPPRSTAAGSAAAAV
jgi:hypothetical protein